MKISKEIKAILDRPLPDEAVSQHETKKFLSSIKAIYVTERMNEAFGVGGWTLKLDNIDKQASSSKKGDMVVIKTTYEVPEFGIYYECYGGNDNSDLGDAYKGATTDALTKIGSYLGIGADVFKGKRNAKSNDIDYDKSGNDAVDDLDLD